MPEAQEPARPLPPPLAPKPKVNKWALRNTMQAEEAAVQYVQLPRKVIDVTPKPKTKQQLRAERFSARQRYFKARRAGATFTRQLRGVAKQIGIIVNGMSPGGVPVSLPSLTNALHRYSDLLRPWAKAVSEEMVTRVALSDKIAWTQHAQSLGRAIRSEVFNAPTGQVFQEMLNEQVALITSLPLKAAQRVHHLTIEALTTTSARASDIANEILRTGHVTESRAMLIARTEVARTASALTMSRAQYVGSEGYIWRTVGDSDVRERHRHMEGKYVRWDSPPQMEPSLGRYHAGMGPNCRCYPEPVLPDIIK